MNNHKIKKITENLEVVLIKKRVRFEINDDTYEQLKAIHKELSSIEKEFSGFKVQDIIEQAKSRGITLTEEQGNNILDLMEERFNAEIGMNWDVIDVLTDKYLKNKINKSQI